MRVFGGRWVRDEQFADKWVVELPNGIGKANPIGKAYKHLEDRTDSVLGFFRVTGLAIEKGGFDKIGRNQRDGSAAQPSHAPAAATSLASPRPNPSRPRRRR